MFRSRRFLLGLIVSIAFIVLLLRKTDLHAVWSAWRHADPRWLLLGLAIEFVATCVRAFRYRYILLSRVDLSTRQLFPILVIGYGANNILPARAGEVVRAYVLGERYHVSKLFALGTIAVERLFDGLALLGLLLAMGLLLGVNSVIRGLALITAPLFLAALAVFIAVIVSPRRSEALSQRLIGVLPQRFREKGQGFVSAFISGLGALRHPGPLAVVSTSSLLGWTLEGTVFLAVARSMGLHPGLGYSIMAMSAANLAITAPSTAGGIGPYEFFAAQAMILTGVTGSAAAAFALAVHAVIIIPVTILSLIFLSQFHLSLTQAVRREEALPLTDETLAVSDG